MGGLRSPTGWRGAHGYCTRGMLLGFKFCSLDHPVDAGIGLHLPAVKVQLLSPYQASLDTQFHNSLEKQLKYFQPITFSDLTQAAVIRDRLIQVIADEPAMRQVEIYSLHQLLFRT